MSDSDRIEQPPTDRPVDPSTLNQPAEKGPFDGDEESGAAGREDGARAPGRPGVDDRFERTIEEADQDR